MEIKFIKESDQTITLVDNFGLYPLLVIKFVNVQILYFRLVRVPTF